MKRYWQNCIWIPPLAALVVIGVRPHPGAPDAIADTLGLLIMILGIGIRVYARGWKYEAGPRILVTDGLYGYMRHPLYLGSFLIGLGLCLIISVPWYTMIYVVWFVVAHFPTIKREEAILARRWPDEHAAYRRQVPLALPSPRQMRRLRRVRPRRLGEAIFREADVVCLWPMVAIALLLWEDVPMGADPRWNLSSALATTGLALPLAVAWLYLRYMSSRTRKRRASRGQR